MRTICACILIVVSNILTAGDIDNLNTFFNQLSKLEFNQAKESAKLEPDKELSSEMLRLADILFNAGQTERPTFDPPANLEADHSPLQIIRQLEQGYISLYYDQVKGTAYREFYTGYQLARTHGNEALIKACLFALLEYHREEIAQNSNSYLTYLNHFENIARDTIDHVWLTVYRSIFQTKPSQYPDSSYFDLATDLEISEHNLYDKSPMLANVFFEKALMFEARNDTDQASTYYLKAIKQAKGFAFLRNVRFGSYIKLMMLATQQNQFQEAEHFQRKAKSEADLADTLRSSYYLNLYSALMLNAADQNDSAFELLKRAYAQDFELDFRRNTLEINRLNVELETQEKENANLQLTQQKNWLISGIAGLGLLAIVGYLVYRNQLAKSALQIQQKEVHSMKLEKQLKEQEITGIDQMIEAQEKERQRIANELHDNLGSHLASIKLYFQNLQQKEKDPAQNELFQKTDQLLEETYQQVRTLAHARNVGVNSKDGLMPAVRSFASKISGANKLTVNVEEHGMDTRLENSLEIMLFRIVQELTTNVIKHAKATEVTINLTRHDDSINLMVEDNGAGFDISQIKPTDTMGLHSIQKRVENLGGTVAIDSIASKGTTVIIDLPI